MPRGWVKPSAPAPKKKSRGQKQRAAPALPSLTPRPTKQTKQYRGAAVLRRGTFISQVAEERALERHGPSREQKQALKILREPKRHLALSKHDDAHAARVLHAASPGPVLQHIIDRNPKLRANQQRILDGLLKKSNSKWYQFSDSIPELESRAWSAIKHSATHPVKVDEAKKLWRETKAVNQFMANIFSGGKGKGGVKIGGKKFGGYKELDPEQVQTLQQAGIVPTAKQGIASKIGTDIAGTGIGVGPGLAYSLSRMFGSPRGLYQEPARLAKETGKSIYESYTHPGRVFARQGGSLELAMNALIPFQLAGGGAARAAAVRGLREARLPQVVPRRVPIKDVKNSFVEEHGIHPDEMVEAARKWPAVSRDLAHHTAEVTEEAQTLSGFHDFKDVTPVAIRDSEGNVHAVGSYARSESRPGYIEPLGLSAGTPKAGLQLVRHIAQVAASKDEGLTFVADEGAVSFYRKLGFKPIDRENNMFVLEPDEVKSFVNRLDDEPWLTIGEKTVKGKPMTARDVAKVLWRPPPPVRKVTFRGKTVASASYKSGLGQYVQRQMDRSLQKGLDDPQHSIVSRMIQNLEGDAPSFLRKLGLPEGTAELLRRSVSPQARFGRRWAKEQKLLLDVKASRPTAELSPTHGPTAPATALRTLTKKDLGALRPSKRAERMTRQQQKDMGPALAREAGVARAHAMNELWHELWDIAIQPFSKEFLESSEWKNKRLIAIRNPKAAGEMNFDPTKHMTEGQLAQRFKNFFTERRHAQSQWNRYRYVPVDLIYGLHPYLTTVKRGAGKVDVQGVSPAETWMANIDKVSQAVRVGRFYHPAYVQNAVQNRMFHLSQAGAFVFRNMYWYRKHFPELSKRAQGVLEESMGASRARALAGEQNVRVGGELTGGELGPEALHQIQRGKIERLRSAGEKFWHNIDDRAVRMQMLYHELNNMGYKTNAQIERLANRVLRGDEDAIHDLTAASQLGNKEAIDYGEMSNIERQTAKRMFIAYGWTRGASTFSGRFPLQHPVQAQLAAELGREGKDKADEFFAAAGGMMPDWLEGIAPLSHSKSPLAIETSWAPPFETPAQFVKGAGLVKGSPAVFSEMFNPAPAAALEALTARGRYGQQLPGMKRYTEPLHEQLISRIRPVGALEAAVTKHPTGTIVGGWKTAAARFFGVPVTRLRDIERTSKSGLKDFRATLSPPARYEFDKDWAIYQIPKDREKMDVSDDLVGQYKGALEAKATMDTELYKFSKRKGYPSWRRLPPTAKVEGAVKYMQKHYGMSKDEGKQFLVAATAIPSDEQIKQLVNAILAPAKAEQETIDVWKKIRKVSTPPKKEKVYSQ